MNILLALSAVTLLGLGTVIRQDSLVWNLSFLVSMTLGFAHSFHAFFTSDSVRQQGDQMPCLVHHAPTHHPTQLGSILGELIVLHLDPDLYLDWRSWLEDFRESILPGYDKEQSWERVLYILHLNAKGDLSESTAMAELNEFIRPDAIRDVLLDEGAKFNWRSLQRLLAHAGFGNRVRSGCWNVCNSTCSLARQTCFAPHGEWMWHWTLNVTREPAIFSLLSTIRPLSRPSLELRWCAPAVSPLLETIASNFRPALLHEKP